MLAAAIMAIAVAALLQLLIVCLISNTTASNQVVAANDAQYVLEKIKGLPYSDIDTCTFPSFTFNNLVDEQVSFSKCANVDNMKEVTVKVKWKERNADKEFQLSTRFAETSFE